MRWFKHLTTASHDEALADLLCESGLEAYGFWWRLVEIVAFSISKADTKCSISYPIRQWSRLLYCHHHAVKKYFLKLQQRGLIQVTHELPSGYPLVTHELPSGYPPVTTPSNSWVTGGKADGKIEVTIPNILKYRDEYSKKSRQYPEIVRSKKQSTETETETETETLHASLDAEKNDPEFWLSRKKRKLAGKRLESFKRFWEAFSYPKARASAIDSWLDIPKLTDSLVELIVAAAIKEAAHRPNVINAGRTPIYAQGWIAARRWEDEVFDGARHANNGDRAQEDEGPRMTKSDHKSAFEALGREKYTELFGDYKKNTAPGPCFQGVPE